MSLFFTKTPLRITFFGGGTDYPSYFLRKPGKTLGAAIDKFTYVGIRDLSPIDEYKFRLSYKESEQVNNVVDIKQPVMREALKMVGDEDRPTEIHYFSDLPSASGLGTSSSFSVGVLNALYARQDTLKSKRNLAELAFTLESKKLQETVGIQDQFTSAIGGILSLDMKGSLIQAKNHIFDDFSYELDQSLIMFFTGVTRFSQNILDEQDQKTKAGDVDGALSELYDIACLGDDIFSFKKDIGDFGSLMHDAWIIKKSISTKISSDHIDRIYNAAMKSGALGGKLMGAGGGGFMLFVAEKSKQKAIRESLSHLIEIPFSFHENGTSSLDFKYLK